MILLITKDWSKVFTHSFFLKASLLVTKNTVFRWIEQKKIMDKTSLYTGGQDL